ncbi:Uncharacterized protein BM_BM17577 [Brugia malayi]|uniref:Small integral membrane protein 15 n=1 Tax=Brugia malayi TaxID=6279 RepID=A0A4E9FFL9_BRUMA|nr:Uncharacterized protein BM_BM17577 [Brugia malayi]VIO94989.1 Uncharacterized protein BM_BM17577 [Brugia malayi]
MFLDDLKDYLSKLLVSLVLWITDDPGSFFMILLLFIAPFLLITVILSWKLHKAIKMEKKRKKLQKNNVRRKKKE